MSAFDPKRTLEKFGMVPRLIRIANMRASYSLLALSYRRWHYRTTPERFEQPGGPAAAFAMFQGMNIFSILMLIPARVIPAWLFVSVPFVVGALVYLHVSNIYRANPLAPRYAALTDPVPPGREFPLVYAYFFCTLVLFVGCLSWAVHRSSLALGTFWVCPGRESVRLWPIADVRAGRPANGLLMSAFDPKRTLGRETHACMISTRLKRVQAGSPGSMLRSFSCCWFWQRRLCWPNHRQLANGARPQAMHFWG